VRRIQILSLGRERVYIHQNIQFLHALPAKLNGRKAAFVFMMLVDKERRIFFGFELYNVYTYPVPSRVVFTFVISFLVKFSRTCPMADPLFWLYLLFAPILY
jgi:hypothetical protein